MTGVRMGAGPGVGRDVVSRAKGQATESWTQGLATRLLLLQTLMIGLVVVALFVAGCGGGSKSSGTSSPTGATASQKVKRLEVTVVRPTAAAQTPRPFYAWATDLLQFARAAEAATCSVTAGGQTVPTNSNGKAVLFDVTVGAGGVIPVSINCDGAVSEVNVTGTPGAVVNVTVEVRPGRVEVKAKGEHVSEPSKPSEPSVSSSDKRRGSNQGPG
jgi:hypothetical protein